MSLVRSGLTSRGSRCGASAGMETFGIMRRPCLPLRPSSGQRLLPVLQGQLRGLLLRLFSCCAPFGGCQQRDRRHPVLRCAPPSSLKTSLMRRPALVDPPRSEGVPRHEAAHVPAAGSWHRAGRRLARRRRFSAASSIASSGFTSFCSTRAPHLAKAVALPCRALASR